MKKILIEWLNNGEMYYLKLTKTTELTYTFSGRVSGDRIALKESWVKDANEAYDWEDLESANAYGQRNFLFNYYEGSKAAEHEFVDSNN